MIHFFAHNDWLCKFIVICCRPADCWCCICALFRLSLNQERHWPQEWNGRQNADVVRCGYKHRKRHLPTLLIDRHPVRSWLRNNSISVSAGYSERNLFHSLCAIRAEGSVFTSISSFPRSNVHGSAWDNMPIYPSCTYGAVQPLKSGTRYNRFF